MQIWADKTRRLGARGAGVMGPGHAGIEIRGVHMQYGESTSEPQPRGGCGRLGRVGEASAVALVTLGLMALLALAISDLGASPRYTSPWGALIPQSSAPAPAPAPAQAQGLDTAATGASGQPR